MVEQEIYDWFTVDRDKPDVHIRQKREGDQEQQMG